VAIGYFTEVVPLFSFTTGGQSRIDLDADTWLEPLDEAHRVRIMQAIGHADPLISRGMVTSLRFGIFHRFALSDPTRIEPPRQDLELDARVIFKILRPDRTLSTGYSAYNSESGPQSGGSRLASEFRWPGPGYKLEQADAARLPNLWRELRRIMSPSWLWDARFFHTARIRLWRAGHDQDPQQRLLDLFIAIESLLLREAEQWGWTDVRGGLPFGPRRLAALLEPGTSVGEGHLWEMIRIAHAQRNTIAHGIDRDLVGFDGTTTTFPDLEYEVERWTTVILHRALRLMYHAGARDSALFRLDALVGNPSANLAVTDSLLTECSGQEAAEPGA
jgi:hypothetical protein